VVLKFAGRPPETGLHPPLRQPV